MGKDTTGRRYSHYLWVLGTMLAFSACGGTGAPPTGGGCTGGGTGALELTVAGLPAGVQAAVTVSGPGGVWALTGSDNLTLPAGGYTVAADVVTEAQATVRKAFDASVSATPLCVQDAETVAVTVAYAAIPSGHRLWVSGNAGFAGANTLRSFDAPALGATATVAASAVFTSDPALSNPRSVAFDRQGKLWVADLAGSLMRFAAEELAVAGAAVPEMVIRGAALSAGLPGPRGLAFDPAGNLWVSVGFSDTLLKYSPAQLERSGEPTPEVEIGTPQGPTGLAFDAAGNLWVSAGARVLRYDAARLGFSGDDPPDLTVEAKTPLPVVVTLGAPGGLAFDAVGNLWVAYFSVGVIAQLTPDDQRGSGEVALTPEVQLSLGAGALLADLAFDEGGGLWTAYRQGTLARLAPAQLGSSASELVPETVLSSDGLAYAQGLAFYPAPAALPLYHRLPQLVEAAAGLGAPRR